MWVRPIIRIDEEDVAGLHFVGRRIPTAEWLAHDVGENSRTP